MVDIAVMLSIEEAIMKQAITKYQDILVHTQISCTHPNIVEGAYKPEGILFGRTEAPFRVCTCCGYAEQGWHCGYSFLNQKKGQEAILTVTREAALKYVRGRIIPNEEHSDVRHGRKILEDVLRK